MLDQDCILPEGHCASAIHGDSVCVSFHLEAVLWGNVGETIGALLIPFAGQYISLTQSLFHYDVGLEKVNLQRVELIMDWEYNFFFFLLIDMYFFLFFILAVLYADIQDLAFATGIIPL